MPTSGWRSIWKVSTDAALDEYRASEQINPDRYQIHYDLGVIPGKVEAVLEKRWMNIARPLLLDADVPALHNAAGGEMAALGDITNALKEFTESERLDPTSAMPHIQAAKALFGEGRVKR